MVLPPYNAVRVYTPRDVVTLSYRLRGADQTQNARDVQETLQGIASVYMDAANGRAIVSADVAGDTLTVQLVAKAQATPGEIAGTLDYWTRHLLDRLKAVYVDPAAEALQGIGGDLLTTLKGLAALVVVVVLVSLFLRIKGA